MTSLGPKKRSRNKGHLSLTLKGFQQKLCNNLYSMWRNSQFCDLTLKVSDDKTISVHSCLLAACSPTIRDILTGFDAQQRAQSNKIHMEVDVKCFSLPVMETIVFTIYTGWLLVKSAEFLREILVACRWLKIQDLISTVEEALKEMETPSDIVSNIDTDRDILIPGSSEKDIFVNNEKNTEKYMEEDFISTSPKTPVSKISASNSTKQISFFQKDLRLQPSNAQKDSSYIVTTSLSSLKDSNSNTLSANSEKLPQNVNFVKLSFSDELVSHEEISPVPQYDSATQISDAMSSRIKQVFYQAVCENNGNLKETCTDSNPSEFTTSLNSESNNVFSNISSASKSPEASEVSSLRKISLKRKKSQEWEESYVTKKMPSGYENSSEMIHTEIEFVPEIRMEVDDFNRYLSSRDTQTATTMVTNSELNTDDHEQARDGSAYQDHSYNKAAETNDSIQTGDPSMDDEILSSPLFCDKCGSRFYKKKLYEKHIDNHPEYFCLFCPSKFYQKIQLVAHIRSIHPQTNDSIQTDGEMLSSPIFCNKCGLKFFKKKSYEKHMDNHQVYSCLLCSAKFYRKDLLNGHMRSTHPKTNDSIQMGGPSVDDGILSSPLICNKCGVKFYDQKHYKNHIDYHPNPMYCCSYCTARFYRKNQFVEHVGFKHSQTDDLDG